MRGGEPSLDPLQAVSERYALFLHVIERRAVARVFAPAGERQVVIVGDRRAGDRAVPVRAGAAQGAEVRGCQAVEFAHQRILEDGVSRTKRRSCRTRGRESARQHRLGP